MLGSRPVTEDCPELNLALAWNLQEGYEVKHYSAHGLSKAEEGGLSLLPPNQSLGPEQMATVRQAARQHLRKLKQADDRKWRNERSYDQGLTPDDVQPVKHLGAPSLATVPLEEEQLQSWLQAVLGLRGTRPQAVSYTPTGFAKRPMLDALLHWRPAPTRALRCVRLMYSNSPRAAERSREWMTHLCDFMGALLSEAVRTQAYAHPAPSMGASEARNHDSKASAAICGWICIHMDSMMGSVAAESWSYLVSLVGASLANGLGDAHVLLTWLLPLLREPCSAATWSKVSSHDSSCASACAVLPLLQACIWEAPLGTARAHALFQTVATRQMALQAAVSPLSANAKLLVQGLAQIMQVLLCAAPTALMAAPSLAMLPTSATDFQLLAPPPLSGTSPDAAAEGAAILAQQVSILGSAVNARVLAYCEADVFQLLDAALPLCYAPTTLAAATAAISADLSDAACQCEVVRIICHWGVTRQLGGRNSWRLTCDFCVTLLTLLGAETEGGTKGGIDRPPPLQYALKTWLDWEAELMGPPSNFNWVGLLVIRCAVVGQFCPAAYLRALVACGALATVDGPRTASGSAALHKHVMHQLHPQLPFPSLQSAMSSSEAGAADISACPPWSEAHRQYAHHRRAVLRSVTSRMLPAKRKAGSERDTSAHTAPADAAYTTDRRADDRGAVTMASQLRHAKRSQSLRAVLAAVTQLLSGLLSDSQTTSCPVPNANDADLHTLPQLIDAIQHLRQWERQFLTEAVCSSVLAAVKSALASSSPGGVYCVIPQSFALLEAAGSSADVATLATALVPFLIDADVRVGVAPITAVLLTALEGRQSDLAACGDLAPALSVLTRAGWQLRSVPQSGSACRACCALAVRIVSPYRDRQDVANWLVRVAQQHPGHWLAGQLAAAARAAPSPAVLHHQLPRISSVQPDESESLFQICSTLGTQRLSHAAAFDSSVEASRKLAAWVAHQPQTGAALSRALSGVVQAIWRRFVAATEPSSVGGTDVKEMPSTDVDAVLSTHLAVLSFLESQLPPSVSAAVAAGGAGMMGGALQVPLIELCRSHFTDQGSGGRQQQGGGGERGLQGLGRSSVHRQAEVMLAGCIAHGLVGIGAALCYASGCVTWVEALLGQPHFDVAPGNAAAVIALQAQLTASCAWAALEPLAPSIVSAALQESVLREARSQQQSSAQQRQQQPRQQQDQQRPNDPQVHGQRLAHQPSPPLQQQASMSVLQDAQQAQLALQPARAFARLWGHPPLAHLLLRCPEQQQQKPQPQQQQQQKGRPQNPSLYGRLQTAPDIWFRPPVCEGPAKLPARLLVSALLDAQPQSGNSPIIQYTVHGLLADLRPSTFRATQMHLRLLLDEQNLRSGCGRGSLHAAAVAAAGVAGGEAPLSPPEQTVAEEALAEIGARPLCASLVARLLWALGRALGTTLLNLQLAELREGAMMAPQRSFGPALTAGNATSKAAVTSTAEPAGGHRNVAKELSNVAGGLSNVVEEREAAATAASELVAAAAVIQPAGSADKEACEHSRFTVESGFVDAVLAGLSCSPFTRQREFAVELIQQLRQLAAVRPGDTAGTSVVSAPGGRVSTAELQCALWLRLSLLPPLLPLVYVDKGTSAGGSLRASLVPILITLANTAWVSVDIESSADTVGGKATRAAAAASAAAAAACQSLPHRLQALAQGLLPGSWPAWLRGSQAKLREVAQFDRCAKLHSDATAVGVSAGVSQRLLLCLPVPPPLHTAPPPAVPYDFEPSLVAATSRRMIREVTPPVQTARGPAGRSDVKGLLAPPQQTPPQSSHRSRGSKQDEAASMLSPTANWDPWSVAHLSAVTNSASHAETSQTLPLAAPFLVGARRHRRPDVAF